MKRGQIVWYSPDVLGSGHEIRRRRPALVLSADATLRRPFMVAVVPLTHTDRPDDPTNVRVTIVGVTTTDAPTLAACDQLRFVDPRRLDDRRSRHADSASVDEVGRVVRLLLGP